MWGPQQKKSVIRLLHSSTLTTTLCPIYDVKKEFDVVFIYSRQHLFFFSLIFLVSKQACHSSPSHLIVVPSHVVAIENSK